MSDKGIYENRTEVAELISVAIKEAVKQGRALGLTWSLRLATVATAQGLADLNAQLVTVTMDGDTVPMSVDNLTGSAVAAGARVAVLQVPPAGNFIIGAPTLGKPVGSTATGSAQSIPNGVGTNLSWTAVTFDSGGFSGTVPFTSFSVPTGLDGIYGVSARMAMTGAGGTRNFLTIVGSIPGVDARAFFGSGESACNTTVILPLSGGDTVSAQLLQNSGGAQTTTAASMSIYRLA